MSNKKILIENTQRIISICNENIKEEQEKIKSYQRIIDNVYKSCEHDFESIAYYAGHVVKCRICGYEDGA